MKKTLLLIVASLAVINVAYAIPSMDVQQKNCEDGQHVWVEKTKTCVPIHPCDSEDSSIRNAYCDEFFGYIHFDDAAKREKLLKKYLNTNNAKVELSSINSERMYSDVMLVKYDGLYKEMPYGWETESFGRFVAHIGACHLYGGDYAESTPYNKEEEYTYCGKIESISQCKELAAFISDLEGRKIDYQYDAEWLDGWRVCILNIPFYGFQTKLVFVYYIVKNHGCDYNRGSLIFTSLLFIKIQFF